MGVGTGHWDRGHALPPRNVPISACYLQNLVTRSNRMAWGGAKNLETLGPYPLGWVWLTPRNMPLLPKYYHAKFCHSKSNDVGIDGGTKNVGTPGSTH